LKAKQYKRNKKKMAQLKQLIRNKERLIKEKPNAEGEYLRNIEKALKEINKKIKEKLNERGI